MDLGAAPGIAQLVPEDNGADEHRNPWPVAPPSEQISVTNPGAQEICFSLYFVT